MKLPDNVLQIVHDYAKPSEPFKLYKRIIQVLKDEISSVHVRELMPKIKKEIRYHYDRFLPIFLQLEKSQSEYKLSIEAVIQSETLYDEYPLRMVYYRKGYDHTWMRRRVIDDLYRL